MQSRLSAQFLAAGGVGGAIAIDLTTKRTVWEINPDARRTPASLEKLLTTSAVLLELGAGERIPTTAMATSGPDGTGTLHGNLYIHGGGDPTVGAQRIRDLAMKVRAAGIRRVTGRIVGDDGFFDSLRSVPSHDSDAASWVDGPLGALVFDRRELALAAASRLGSALRRLGVKVPAGRARAGASPAHAKPVATVWSPPVSALIARTNAPSDNFMAEMLLKLLGARKEGRGSTAAGIRAATSRLAKLDVHPRMADGSGLSRADAVSPRHLVRLLRAMSRLPAFPASLSVAGRSGTLSERMRRGPAAGRCRGKTGTLRDVSGLAGYCPSANGHVIAFAVMMNRVDPIGRGRPHQDAIAQILAGWRASN